MTRINSGNTLSAIHPIAAELNAILENSIAWPFLSEFGKRIYFPKGIVAQSQEAGKKATRFNATAGVALSEGAHIRLSGIESQLPGLNSSAAVGYAPTAGDPVLRKQWKREILAKNPGIRDDAVSMPVVVPGITSGISQIADLFLNPEDTVVVPDLFWSNYELIFKVRREARIVTFPLFDANNAFNTPGLLQAVESASASGKTLLVLNFPNNPTGYSPTVREAGAISAGLKTIADSGRRILVLTDDAYFGLYYEDDIYRHSLFTRLYDLHPNILAVKADGTTKEDFVWGFRIGFVTFGSPGLDEAARGALEEKMKGALRCSVSSSSRPAQSMLIRAMQDSTYHADKRRYTALLKSRYLQVKSILSEGIPGRLLPLPFNSGYFMSFQLHGGGADALRKRLIEEEGTGLISLQDNYLRVAYSSVEQAELEPLFRLIFAAV